jgi:hypothetical protein
MGKQDSTPWLHIVPQFSFHGEAEIRGSSDGLRALRDAIDAALSGGAGEATVFASNGEGYGVTIVRCNTVGALGKPYYADQVARDLASYEIQFHMKHYAKKRPVWGQR